MPSVASERLYGGVLDDTTATVFTATLRTEVTLLRIADATTSVDSDALAVVYHVPKGDTRGDEHLIYAGGAIVDAPSSVGAGVVLESGDKLDAGADTADELVLTIYGTTESIVGGDG